MKAVVAHRFGPPDTLALQERAPTQPGPGEVSVRVHWAGVSFVDVLTTAGRYQHRPALPFVPGSEFSGLVQAVGDGVEELQPGDPVCGGRMGGTWAQLVILPASRVQKLGPASSLQHASVLRASSLTAWYALVERGRLAAGETVLVLGAAGAVGIACCQLASLLGARVIASASSPEKRALALCNGAQHAVDGRAQDWRAQVRTLCDGAGPDIVVDPVGGADTERAFRSINHGGRHLVVGFASGTIPKLPANLALLKGAALVGVLASHFTEREPNKADAARKRILELFEEGVLTPPIGATYPLARFAEAMQAASEGQVPGRVLLDMRDGEAGTDPGRVAT